MSTTDKKKYWEKITNNFLFKGQDMTEAAPMNGHQEFTRRFQPITAQLDA